MINENEDLLLGLKVWKSVILRSTVFKSTSSEERQREKQLHVGVFCPGEKDSHSSDLVHWNDSRILKIQSG